MAKIQVTVPQSLLDDESKKVIKENAKLRKRIAVLTDRIDNMARDYERVKGGLALLEGLHDSIRDLGIVDCSTYHDDL